MMTSQYFPVSIYNKYKPVKYRVGFFILADSKYNFIFCIDVYQDKDTENIDIHSSLNNLRTTQKYAFDSIIKSGISNYLHGSRHICIDR